MYWCRRFGSGHDGLGRLAHNRQLSGLIIAEADRLRLPLVSPRADAERGGSVMLSLPAGAVPHGVQELLAGGVQTDVRGSVLRLSPGELTTEGGVTRLLEGLRKIIKVAA